MPDSLKALLLTHAHIDHCGRIPLLVKEGFPGSVYSTSATKDLCEIMLKTPPTSWPRQMITRTAILVPNKIHLDHHCT